jgi:hypothetical protein
VLEFPEGAPILLGVCRLPFGLLAMALGGHLVAKAVEVLGGAAFDEGCELVYLGGQLVSRLESFTPLVDNRHAVGLPTLILPRRGESLNGALAASPGRLAPGAFSLPPRLGPFSRGTVALAHRLEVRGDAVVHLRGAFVSTLCPPLGVPRSGCGNCGGIASQGRQASHTLGGGLGRLTNRVPFSAPFVAPDFPCSYAGTRNS